MLDELIDRYCLGWTLSDEAARNAALAVSCSEDVVYIDPTRQAKSLIALQAMISDIQLRRPGATVRRTSQIQCHHGVARFNWQVVMPDGTSPAGGVDFVELTHDGRKISLIIGFVGDLT